MNDVIKQLGVLIVLTAVLEGGSFSAAAEKAMRKTQMPEIKSTNPVPNSSQVQCNHHPIIDEHILPCNDCHQIRPRRKVDASSKLDGKPSPQAKQGPKDMQNDQIRNELIKAIGQEKGSAKVFELGTCLNNQPFRTKARFTFDAKTNACYGLHPAASPEVKNMSGNTQISLTWLKEPITKDTNQNDFVCVQFKGTATFIDGTNKEFDKRLSEFISDEDIAQATGNAKPGPQNIKGRFVLSKIAIDLATISSAEFSKNDFKVIQRWKP